MGQHGMAELAQQGSVSWASTAWPSWPSRAELGQHGVAELCLLATQWGSLGVAATRPELCVVPQAAPMQEPWGNG